MMKQIRRDNAYVLSLAIIFCQLLFLGCSSFQVPHLSVLAASRLPTNDRTQQQNQRSSWWPLSSQSSSSTSESGASPSPSEVDVDPIDADKVCFGWLLHFLVVAR